MIHNLYFVVCIYIHIFLSYQNHENATQNELKCFYLTFWYIYILAASSFAHRWRRKNWKSKKRWLPYLFLPFCVIILGANGWLIWKSSSSKKRYISVCLVHFYCLEWDCCFPAFSADVGLSRKHGLFRSVSTPHLFFSRCSKLTLHSLWLLLTSPPAPRPPHTYTHFGSPVILCSWAIVNTIYEWSDMEWQQTKD